MESDTKKGLYQARSHGEAPDIDGIVYLKSKRSLESGMFVQGRITRADSYDSWATETAIKQ
jgi:ribosomal protein S12 methylthiotransferase